MEGTLLPRLKYRPDIDGLRAIAILSVVAFHAFPSHVQGGFVGVDIFFVISGYLISSIIFKGLDSNTFRFSEFYARRIRRIFPALVLVLLACLIFGWFALLAPEYEQLSKHIAASAGFIQNFILWQESGYFDNSGETKPLLHIWSLGIEEQFYILFPLALWITWKFRISFLTVVISVIFISFYLNFTGIKDNPTAAFYSPQTRFWELMFGSLLAWVNIYKWELHNSITKKLNSWQWNSTSQRYSINANYVLINILSLLGLSLLAYGIMNINKESIFPGTWALFPVLGSALVIFAGPNAWVNRYVLSSKLAIWFGLISYPLYLWHWPIFSFVRIMEEEEVNTGISVVAILVSILLATFTYYFVERPFRAYQTGKLKVSILLFVASTLIISGVSIFLMNGIPSRSENIQNIEHVEALFESPYTHYETYECKQYLHLFNIDKKLLRKVDGQCLTLQPKEPSILFIGDSHTIHYANSLSQAGLSKSIAIIQGNNCLPFSGHDFMQEVNCNDLYNRVISFLNQDKKIRTIYLSAFWAKSISGGEGAKGINWRLADAPGENDIQSFLQNGRKFLNAALKNGRHVVFMHDIPILDFDIKRCFDVRPLRFTPNDNFIQDCSINVADYINSNGKFFATINLLLSEFPDVETYDPKNILCDQFKCKAKINKKPLYYNGDHVNFFGSNFILNDMISKGIIK